MSVSTGALQCKKNGGDWFVYFPAVQQNAFDHPIRGGWLFGINDAGNISYIVFQSSLLRYYYPQYPEEILSFA